MVLIEQEAGAPRSGQTSEKCCIAPRTRNRLLSTLIVKVGAIGVRGVERSYGDSIHTSYKLAYMREIHWFKIIVAIRKSSCLPRSDVLAKLGLPGILVREDLLHSGAVEHAGVPPRDIRVFGREVEVGTEELLRGVVGVLVMNVSGGRDDDGARQLALMKERSAMVHLSPTSLGAVRMSCTRRLDQRTSRAR